MGIYLDEHKVSTQYLEWLQKKELYFPHHHSPIPCLYESEPNVLPALKEQISANRVSKIM